MKKIPLSKKTKYIIISFSFVFLLILLGLWTKGVYRDRKTNELRDLLEAIISERGEEGLFQLAGIPTESLNYGDSDLYINGRGAWTYEDEELVAINAYEKAKEATVQIISRSSLSSESQGSGVIITSDGYIVTNRHVLDEDSNVIVNFYDGSSSDASLVGYDSLTDIAVLKCNRTNLKAIEFSSHSVAIGSTSYAIGNPYGFTWSLTKGMVSGLERTLFSPNGLVIPNLIQSDNTINPGNSGGPLLDSSGAMIGLVSSIYTTTGSSQGLSFSIPSETVKAIASTIIENGKVDRGIIDAYVIELNAQLVSYMGLNINKGLLISETEEGGNAERSGLLGGAEAANYGSRRIYLGGDIIVALNGFKIESLADYFSALYGTAANEEVDISIYRRGRRVNTKIRLSGMDDDSMRYIIR